MLDAMPPPAKAPTRPLRADAARNLERVVDAATDLFAERGLEVGVDEIAARAGVGMGTLYRRFPNKDALIKFLVADLVSQTLLLADNALAEPDGIGLESLLRGVGELQAANPGCLTRLWRDGFSPTELEHLRGVLRRLLTRAHEAGAVRPEITVTDVSVLLWSLQQIVTMTVNAAPDAWRRHLDILLAGISPRPRKISHRPLTQHELDAINDSQS
jgi:AcrR family transcriptional regulator